MRKFPLHPVLFALYPVLFLYAHNLSEVRPQYLAAPAAAAVGLALVALGVSWLVVRNWRTAGLIASAFVLSFFSYGHAVDAAFRRASDSALGWADALLALVWLGVFVLVAIILSDLRGELRTPTAGLNLLSGALVAVTLLAIVPYEAHRPSQKPQVPIPAAKPVTGPRPDIYYFILDRYTGNRQLKEFLSYDNREFLSFLRDKGFTVVDDGRTNYTYTLASLMSSLNMNYLEALQPEEASPGLASRPAQEFLRDYAVEGFLRTQGYTSIHLGSWWEGTRQDAGANVSLLRDGPLTTDFASVLLGTTLARPALAVFQMQDKAQRHRAHALYELAQLETIARRPSPKYVFAHLLLPHPPYVFDAQGRTPTAAEAANTRRAYVQQLQYVNRRMEVVLARILAESRTPPVIVLQGDHGPTRQDLSDPSHGREGGPVTHSDDPVVGILNAYYLPGGKASKLYPTITPVNTFRLIFREYFGADWPLLPDRPATERSRTEEQWAE